MAINQTKKTPKRRSHEERVELSVRRMFDATESLILDIGTQKTTLKEVGEKAGYSRGLAHARFGSKETLFLQLAQRCRQTWLEEVELAAGNKRGLKAFLSRLEAIASYAERYPKDARVMYILWFESVGSPSTMKSELSRFHRQARDDIRQLIEDAVKADEVTKDINAEHFAMQFTSTMFGLSYQWVVDPKAVDIRTMIDEIRRDLLLVLQPPARPDLEFPVSA